MLLLCTHGLDTAVLPARGARGGHQYRDNTAPKVNTAQYGNPIWRDTAVLRTLLDPCSLAWSACREGLGVGVCVPGTCTPAPHTCTHNAVAPGHHTAITTASLGLCVQPACSQGLPPPLLPAVTTFVCVCVYVGGSVCVLHSPHYVNTTPCDVPQIVLRVQQAQSVAV